jgi:hypothetical protein
MRLLLVSHTYTLPANRPKLVALRNQLRERRGELMVLVPKAIREPWGLIAADIGESERSWLREWPASPAGRSSLRMFRPGWRDALIPFHPTHVHVEEEPFSLMALQLAAFARRRGAGLSFFSWENLERDLNPIQRLVERAVCSLARAAIAGNLGAQQRLAKRMLPSRVHLAPQMGVGSPPPASRPAPSSQLRVIFLGRLVPEKGIDTLIDATRAVPAVRLTVGGAGPLGAHLASLGQRHVNFIGPVGRNDVPAVLAGQDVLVLPSRTTPTWAEQFGHVLIEAMAVGVIPVGSSSGAIPEVIGDARLIFDEGDSGHLARVLQRLADEPAWRKSLSKSFAERARDQYSHEIVAQSTVAMLSGE